MEGDNVREACGEPEVAAGYRQAGRVAVMVDADRRIYRCPLGHLQRGSYEVKAFDGMTMVASSGPVCRMCYVRWIGGACATELVTSDATNPPPSETDPLSPPEPPAQK